MATSVIDFDGALVYAVQQLAICDTDQLVAITVTFTE